MYAYVYWTQWSPHGAKRGKYDRTWKDMRAELKHKLKTERKWSKTAMWKDKGLLQQFSGTVII